MSLIAGLAVAGPALAVPGAGLLVLGLLAPVWVRLASSRVHVHARLLDVMATEGERLRLEVSVDRGRVGLGLDDGLLCHELATEPMPLSADTPGRGHRVILTLTAPGRGRHVLSAPRLLWNDPLGLARVGRREAHPAGTVLVLPAVEPVRWLDDDEIAVAADGPPGLAAGVPSIDIVGLRTYQPGTPATRIHWPAVARGGELLERVFASEVQLAPMIAVDPRCADPAQLDPVIRATASLTLALARRSGVDLVLPGRGVPLRITSALSAWPAALRALAHVEAVGLNAAPPRAPAGAGVLFYACSEASLAAGAHPHWAGRVLTLAPAPGGLTPPGAVLEVAGCVAWPTRVRR